MTLVIILFLRKHILYAFLQELNLRFAEIALAIRIILYAWHTVKSVINKVLDLASNGKQRLGNYKSHIKNKNPTCRIVKHFIDHCNDPHLPFKCLGFLIIGVLNNKDDLSENDIESLLLQKENFWIGTLVTQHKGLNGSHDWNRHKRIHRDM